MASLVFPVFSCTSGAKANFLVSGKATKVNVHAWLWTDTLFGEALIISSDGKTLVIANQQTGFQSISDI